MHYALYLFDFDYTLVDSSAGIIKCFHTACEKLDYPKAADETIRHTIGMPMLEAIKIIIKTNDDTIANKFLTVYRQYADKYMTPGTHFFPGALDTLHELQRKNAKTGIISSKNRSRIAEKFTADHAEDAIDHIIGVEDVKNPKPDPEGILNAITYFKTAKKDTLYIGDSLYDAEAAKNAGVDFIGITTGTTTKKDFSRFPSIAIIADIKELLVI